jgi:hypothetical protein
MKKYLMTGIAAIAMCAAFTSCSRNTGFEVMSPEEKVQQVQESFLSDFNTTFNVSASDYANHQWGMDIVPLVDITGTTTRTAEPRGNEWESMGYTVPADISEAEYNAVMAVFNTVGEESYTSLVDWDCFFVQQVHKGTATYYPRNQYIDTDYSKGLKAGATPIVGSDHMDWLCTVAEQKLVTTCWWPLKTEIQACDPYDDHIFDFNNSNSDDYGGRMLMVNSNTNVFGYYNSEDSKVHYEFRMEYIAPYGYFVGFDFYGNGGNPNQDIKRDKIYNDWVVKIVPGKGVTPPVERVRIMAEDLGAAVSDFDYNDIVFDIKFIKNGNQYTADIILQAAGGTLPLTIGGLEVHNLFNVSVTDMVNTGAGPERDPVSFTVDLPEGTYNTAWDAINALPIYVQNPNGQVIQLTVNPGDPAEMIAVPVTTEWAGERVPIKDAYPAFVDWISNPEVKWWD